MKTNLSHPCFRPKKKEPFLLSTKFVAVFFIVSLFLPLLAIAVFSHPGRTDSSGGHYNRSTGEYHYHHGYPAHSHENGICPYDFDDKTASKSSSNSSKKRKKRPVPTSTENKSTESKTPNNKAPESKSDNTWKFVAIVIIGAFIVVAILCEVKNK